MESGIERRIDPKEQIDALDQGYEYFKEQLRLAEAERDSIGKDSPDYFAANQRVIDLRTRLVNAGSERKNLEDKAA